MNLENLQKKKHLICTAGYYIRYLRWAMYAYHTHHVSTYKHNSKVIEQMNIFFEYHTYEDTTYKSLAKDHNVTPARIRNIVMNNECRIRIMLEEGYLLPKRYHNETSTRYKQGVTLRKKYTEE